MTSGTYVTNETLCDHLHGQVWSPVVDFFNGQIIFAEQNPGGVAWPPLLEVASLLKSKGHAKCTCDLR